MSTDTLSCMDIDLSISRVSPSEQLITLPLGQLQALIQEATERAIEPLEDRIKTLEKDLEILAENQLIQLRLINQLRKEPEAKESPLIDELYAHMKTVGLKQTTFSGAAKILKVTKGRVHQLKTTIALDQRFIILVSESHKQRLVIRLRECHKI
jgi:hypothetical protein